MGLIELRPLSIHYTPNRTHIVQPDPDLILRIYSRERNETIG